MRTSKRRQLSRALAPQLALRSRTFPGTSWTHPAGPPWSPATLPAPKFRGGSSRTTACILTELPLQAYQPSKSAVLVTTLVASRRSFLEASRDIAVRVLFPLTRMVHHHPNASVDSCEPDRGDVAPPLGSRRMARSDSPTGDQSDPEAPDNASSGHDTRNSDGGISTSSGGLAASSLRNLKVSKIVSITEQVRASEFMARDDDP